MNLSFYLLLAPATADDQTAAADPLPGLLTQPAYVPVYDPLQRGRAGNRRLVQASRNARLVPAGRRSAVQNIGLGMSVLTNALGFLAISGGALLLLRAAEISLS